MISRTPVKMVNTRSTTRRAKDNACEENATCEITAGPSNSVKTEPSRLHKVPPTATCASQPGPSSSMKLESCPPPKVPSKAASICSKRSCASFEARRKSLLLEAEKRKAEIKMQLIDKQLEADLANLEEELYSPSDGSETDARREVENWMERSQLELDKQEVHASEHEKGFRHPPVTNTGTLDGTIQMLAAAVKNLSTPSAQVNSDSKLLSRLSTPKELPEFAGDPLDWLQFKQSYEESTTLCNFTPKENLWRLRKCLRGQAKEAVSALFISATSPERIMSTLELRFGDPDNILSRLTQDLKKIQPLLHDYHRDIVIFSVKVQNFVEAVRAVGKEEYIQGMSTVSTILAKMPTVLLSKWTDYSFPIIQTKPNKSRLEILSEFLNAEAIKVSATANIYTLNARTDTYKQRQTDNSNARSHTVLLQAEKQSEDMQCQFCRASKHKLVDCKKFRKTLCKARWQYVKRYGICFKCLEAKHLRDACPAPACNKDNCGRAHHNLLHYPNKHNTEDAPQQEPEQSQRESATASTVETVTHVNASVCKVLLKVVPVRVYTKDGGYIETSALLDDGSTVTMISAELADRAGLRGRRESMHVCGPWSNNKLVCDTTVLDLRLSGIDNKVYCVKARSVKELNLPIQKLSVVNCDMFNHLQSIKNTLCNVDTKPEILIGQDNCQLLLPVKVVLGKSYEPSATLTPLGWSVHGSVNIPKGSRGGSCAGAPGPDDANAVLHVAELDSEERELRVLHEEVRRAFTLEAMGVAGKPRVNIDDARAVEQLEQTVQLIDGRWHVGLPWRNPDCTMPDTYCNALKRLEGVERKMKKDTGYAERYAERIEHLLSNSFARELKDAQRTERTWHLPHFGVDNPNKRKLRLVFDAANEVEGLCLNDYLLKGPDLLTSLFGIMLRFREDRIAVTGDIQDMFLRIKILLSDQDALRFLWRESPDDPVRTYAMTSLIFGAKCSPFIAQFVKNKNAQRYESSMPAAVDAIVNSHYMDDYIQSLPDEKTAIDMVHNISHIHKEGGFHMRNWTSNSVAVLDSVPKDTLGTEAVKFKIDQQCDGERTLGLIWYPSSDELAFDVSFKRIPEAIMQGKERPTKRIMLRVVMSIYDVYGFLSPFTIQGKIMLQATWRSKISWDDAIPKDLYCKWLKWIELLQLIDKIRIPRCYQSIPMCASETTDEPASDAAAVARATEMTTNAPTQAGYEKCYDARFTATKDSPHPECYRNLQLHVFSDAGQQALCAAAYWRWISSDNKTCVALVASKCRVAPVKPVTMPRLELQAALLAARLAHTIATEHKLKPEQRYFWCDSTTVLYWLRNNTRTYKAFEANRLGEIDDLTGVSEWRYVPTKLNIADIATRDVFNYDCFVNEWFRGPQFLYKDTTCWPHDVVEPENKDLINLVTDCTVGINNSSDLPVPDVKAFSSWLRLLRSAAAVLKFINKCKKLTSIDESVMMKQAECLLLKKAQADSFCAEINLLKCGKCIPRDSRLRNLSPYLDEQGLLRVGGRIDAVSDVALETKRPYIIDGRHPITKLIVRHYHVKAAHGNQEAVVNHLKQMYWVIRIRPAVKEVASKCFFCRLRRVKPAVPRMGDLPEARMAHHQRPFTFCGIDLFGPMEVVVGRRREKRYGVLFTCLTIRAIHIELVHFLTTDSLIMALRRMSCRRGWPRYIYSDNGTNLRGADVELSKAMQELDDDALRTEAVNNGALWTFIPPVSPHWGGAWERLIRSVKSSLRVILKERAPKDEVLRTLLVEVENIVNGRPLTHVSVEPGSTESLTPNHFLIGSSSNLPTAGVFDDSDLFLRKQWRQAQRLADMYWQRWLKEYLPTLVPRTKWHQEQNPLKVGDLVFIADPDWPRNTWPRGIINKVFPGKDGRVRVVEVRTSRGVLRRSAARVAPIPLSLEC